MGDILEQAAQVAARADAVLHCYTGAILAVRFRQSAPNAVSNHIQGRVVTYIAPSLGEATRMVLADHAELWPEADGWEVSVSLTELTAEALRDIQRRCRYTEGYDAL